MYAVCKYLDGCKWCVNFLLEKTYLLYGFHKQGLVIWYGNVADKPKTQRRDARDGRAGMDWIRTAHLARVASNSCNQSSWSWQTTERETADCSTYLLLVSSCVVPLLWLALKVTWSRPSSFLLVGMASSLNTTPSGSKGATPSSSSLNRLSTASTEGKTEGNKLRNANPSQYVKLNVGGSLHYTTVGTLTKVSTSCLIT